MQALAAKALAADEPGRAQRRQVLRDRAGATRRANAVSISAAIRRSSRGGRSGLGERPRQRRADLPGRRGGEPAPLRHDAPGAYQGVFAIGQATAQTIAPAAMTMLVVAGGAPGWYLLAALFAVAVLPATAATRWAIHTRTE